MTVACACGGIVGPFEVPVPSARPGSPAPPSGDRSEILLHLPDIHCALCITTVESALGTLPAVAEARVNLGLKRATIRLRTATDPAVLVDALKRAGIASQPLDAALLTGPEDRSGVALLLRVGIAGFAMMNVMLLSVAVWSGAEESTARVFHLLSALIAVPAVAYSAKPFFAGALAGLRARRPGMDLPIAVAILLATVLSLRQTLFASGGLVWFDAALALTFFLLAGRYLDHRGRAAARSAARALAALDVRRALRIDADGERMVPADTLRPGDRVRVLPGMRAPADGRVVSGESDIDCSAMTGESAPVFASIGTDVQAGSTILTGALTLSVVRAGRDTALSRMTDLIAQAEEARGAYLSLADKAARAYVPVIHLLALSAFLGWAAYTDDAWRAAEVAVSVLIITCPCALGLAVPAVSVAASGRLFRMGLLVKSRTALERLASIDTVVFDKTGTLTTGEPEICTPPEGVALEVGMGLAAASGHPLARAIAACGQGSGATAARITDAREIPGFGVVGRWKGREVSLGRGANSDRTTAWIDMGCGAPVEIAFRETLRPDAAEAVSLLVGMGLHVVLMSGDAPGPVTRLADAVGIRDARAGLSPQDKIAAIAAMRRSGARVLMVGDGLNDTGALAFADAAIAPGTALDASLSAADAVLLAPSLRPVADALDVARRARLRMRENIAIAGIYNLVAIPLALAGFATPLLAAIAMSTSSLTVSLNAARVAR